MRGRRCTVDGTSGRIARALGQAGIAGQAGVAMKKKVGLQAYHIINNVVRNLQRVPAGGLEDFCRLLAASGVHVPAWTATGLTSALTAVRWPTVKAQGRRTHIPEPTFGARGADAATASAAPAEASHILAVPAEASQVSKPGVFRVP